jgi:hypothetical protein
MKRLFQYLFRRCSQRKAQRIAAKAYLTPAEERQARISKEAGNAVYCPAGIKEPCWWVYAPWNDGWDGWMLRSSRVMLISKRTGEILYDGSAGDEG